jgi:elongation factor Ts
MLDCKKALEETGGDIEKAVELLRKKGIAVAAKRSSNVTENGVIQGAVDAAFKHASLVEIGCETDFASRTQDLKNFSTQLAEDFMLAGKAFASIDEFMTLPIKQLGLSAQEALEGLIARISEKIVISRVEVANSSDAELTNIYIHPDGTLGVLVTVAADKPMAEAHRMALAGVIRDLCMQVAVTNPVSISRELVDPALLAKEREIATEVLQKSGKPAAIIDKIVEGKLRKFYEENCLVEQKFIKDEQLTVGQYLEQAGKQHALQLKVVRAVRFGIKR